MAAGPTRNHLLLAATFAVLAAMLRLWNLTHLGLTHFDEGSYAMTGRWLATLGKEGWIYQSGHAPGLFPTVAGLFFLLFGVKDFVAIAVSALAGALTVGLVYVAARSWFAQRTACWAALFLATAQYHVIYSRLALTDALFTLFFWAALFAFYQAHDRGRPGWFALAGIATGLCGNTKYHGFFPLLVAAVWYGGHIWRRDEAAPRLRRGLGLAAMIAALLTLPWVAFVQISVGYGAILRNLFAHSLGRGQVIVTPPGTIYFYLSHWLSPPLLVASGIGAIAALFGHARPPRYVLLAILLNLAAAILYASFPRLILPVVPGLCLLAAVGLDSLPLPSRGRTFATTASALVILGWSLVPTARTLRLSTTAYREAARYLGTRPGPVLTQMSKNFYFYETHPSHELRWLTASRRDSLLHAAPTVTVAVDPIIHRLPEVESWFAEIKKTARRIRTFPIQMYEPVYYQGFAPRDPLEDLPRSRAPFVPGRASIDVYEYQNPEVSGRW